MGLEDVEVAVEVEIADPDPHAGLLHAVFVERDAALEAGLGERAVVIVAEEEAGRGIAGDVDVRPAVVIEIGRDRGHAVAALGFGDARRIADVRERAVAVVVVERDRPGGKSARAAVDRHALPSCSCCSRRAWARTRNRTPDSWRRTDRAGRRGRNRRTCSPSPSACLVCSEPGLLRDIGERAVAVVAVEHVLVPSR